MKRSKLSLIVLYLLAILFLIAILRYLVFYTFGLFPDASDKLIIIRVFLSGPFLILIGSVLLFGFKNLTHKIAGSVFAITGILWLVEIIKTVIEESA